MNLAKLQLTPRKEVALNTSSTVVRFIINIGISFFLSPYIVRVLGAEANGFVNLSNNFISYFSIVVIALNGMATRFIAVEYHKGNLKKANEYYSSLFFGDLVLVIVFGVVSIVCIWKLEFILDISSNIVSDVKLLFSIIFLNYLISTLITIWNCATYIANKIYLDSIRNVQYSIIRVIIIVALFIFFEPKVYYLGIAILIGNLVVDAYNCYYKILLIPELRVKKSNVKWSVIKELLSSGIWNSLSRAGGLLETGLDLLLANVFIGPIPMGILSVSKSMPSVVNELNYTLANVFLPSMVRDYAKENIDSLVRNIKSSSKILSVVCSVPLCFLIVYGKEFYSLWQPTLDAQELHILSVLTCFAYVFFTGTTSLLNIFTTYNKVKQNSISVLVMGLSSAVITIICLKFTDLGVYAIAGVSSMVNIIRFLVFVIPYSAKCLGLRWTTFYTIVFQSIATVVISSICGYMLKLIVPSNTWITLIISAALFFLLGLLVCYLTVFNKKEKKMVLDILKSKLIRRK